jgi:hypothetical protein
MNVILISRKQLLLAKSDNGVLKIPNSDFFILAAILSAIGGIGVWEGYEVHPAFYSQSGVIFGAIGYFAYRVFWLERTQEQAVLPSSNAA